MKKLTFILSALFVLLVVSCTNELENTLQEGKLTFSSISASMGDLPTARVHLEGDGKVVWDLYDQLGVWSDEIHSPIPFTCTNVTETEATFSEGNISGSKFYAYSPLYSHNTVNDNELSFFLPSQCEYDEGATYFEQAPIVAKSNTNEFKFKHTCGYIRFSLTGTKKIKSLTLRGHNNEKIAGYGTIDLDSDVPVFILTDGIEFQKITLTDLQLSSTNSTDFFFAVPVGDFTKGLSLEIEYLNDNSSVSSVRKITTKTIKISRSVIKNFTVFDTDDLIEESGEDKIHSALMAFYNATDGANWYNSTNWGSDKPFSEWYGLIVENGQVTQINLDYNNLKGNIPEEIVSLKFLKHLNLGANKIDSIPSFLGELSLLESIKMPNCNLSGKIPEEVVSLAHLRYLYLNENNLEGDINILSNLSNTIEEVHLGSNSLSGSIPADLGDKTNLKYLDMSFNKITGNIPQEIEKLLALEELYLGDNMLSGIIPDGIGKLIKLTKIDLSQNNLSGNIPEGLSKLPLLSFLHLGWNELSGGIPYVLGDCPALEELHLYNNKLEGEIPAELANIETLKILHLSDNMLSGEIPKEIANLINLETLSFASNQLTGMIPEEFINLSKLKYLYLDNNKLNGECSVEMTEFIENLDFYTIVQQNGYELKINFYISTDFSKDGIVQKLQTHSKGNGINFVITIDGFSDRQITDGTVDGYLQKAYEALFSEEPYVTFKDYFDVYTVLTVSRREIIGEDIALKTTYIGDKYSLNYDKVEEYVQKVPAFNGGITNNTHILVLLNDKSYYRANCAYTSYGSIACSNILLDDNDMVKTIRHETLGHGVGRLGDEYVEAVEPGTTTNNPYEGYYPEENKQGIWDIHQQDFYLNVDVTNDSGQIVWKEFLNNDDYKVEKIGIYEGALLYAKGAYRPTEQSIMRHNVGGFNAPSRWAIYKHILEAAGETPTFEAFLEYDKKNLNTTSAVSARSVSEEPFDTRKLGAPPVFLNR